MQSKLIASLVAFAAALVLVASSLHSDASQRGVVSSPLTVLTGNDSHVRKEAFLRITSSADWKKIWLKHLGMNEDTIYRPAMEVDFTRCEVIAVFEGESVNSCGLRVDSVIENGETVVVRYDDISYQTGSTGKKDHGDRVTPYAFIVLPALKKEVRLEDNVQQYIGEPPQWEEVAKLAALRK